MPLMILLGFKCSTKVSEKSDMTKSWATFVAQELELIKTVKLKCCGIKELSISRVIFMQ